MPGRGPAQRLASWLGTLLATQLGLIWAQPQPGIAARLLQPLSWVYGGLTVLHRGAYRLGLRRAQSAPVPLLVVGNLVVGGAGKTPTVMAVVQLLREQGWTPGVVSRGHGRSGAAVQLVNRSQSAAVVGDEPLLIYLRTGAPVAVGADRAAAARALCAAHLDIPCTRCHLQGFR